MSEDQFTKLFKEITAMQLQLKNMATKDDIAELRDEMHTGFDQIAARLDDDNTERGALQSEVNRHDTWIKQLAKNTNTKLQSNA